MPNKSTPLTKKRIEKIKVPAGKDEIWLRDALVPLLSRRMRVMTQYRVANAHGRPRTVSSTRRSGISHIRATRT